MEDSQDLEQNGNPSYVPEPPPSRKRLLIPVILVLAVIVAALLAIKASTQKQMKINQAQVEVTEGAVLPDLELTRMDGGTVRLGDLNHKVMLINFWATWCEACIEEMPSLNALREKFSPKGFEILGVNVDENPHPVATTAAVKLGMKFPLFSDPKGELGEIFDIHAIPLSLIISRSRKVLMVEPGGRDWNNEEIHQLMEKWLGEP
ncbi:MAG: TlpA family protein disulfide reductase [Bdellovibrionales bacterium]|nr:TlpA family protein disulfide reductase [Bdellovibrionales bacterium]